jgi:hypothetical protein
MGPAGARLSGLSQTARPDAPRPAMSLAQQADLLEYFHGRISLSDGRAWITADVGDKGFADELWLTAQRLRRLAGHEDAIRALLAAPVRRGRP